MKEPQKSTKPNNLLVGALKGAIIAIGAMLPGISGGALCVVLGIYKPMMKLLSNPLKQLKKQFMYFLPIGIGFLVGALLIAKALGSFMEAAETAALFLFIGLILGTLPSLFKEARLQGVTSGSWVALGAGLVVMLAWMIPMSMAGQATIVPNLGWWCLCGLLWGMGMIIPGMSPSNIFFFLGLATPMYAAIGRLDMSVILPMGLCLLASVIGLSNGVQYCLKRWYSIFMHGVIGVVLASTLMILPPVKALLTPGYSYATDAASLLIYVGCLALGAVCAWGISKIDKPAEEQEDE